MRAGQSPFQSSGCQLARADVDVVIRDPELCRRLHKARGGEVRCRCRWSASGLLVGCPGPVVRSEPLFGPQAALRATGPFKKTLFDVVFLAVLDGGDR